MKRNLTNLKRKHYRAMKRWMGKKKKYAMYNCPWIYMSWSWIGCKKNSKLCKSIFPRLPVSEHDGNFRCPCNVYSYKYVRRVIRTILRNHSHD